MDDPVDVKILVETNYKTRASWSAFPVCELVRTEIGWDNRFQQIPILRNVVPAFIPCWNYTGMIQLSEDALTEWAILDTFSSLAPWHDNPQAPSTVETWFKDAGLTQIDVRQGSNGIVGNATKSMLKGKSD